MREQPLVVLANRLPIDETISGAGTREWRRSPGGLVSALQPVLRGYGTTWVGWAGGTGPAPELPDLDEVKLRAVELSEAEFAQYYEGFANSTLWPLYHDAVEQPVYHRRWWESYQQVNRRFAEVAAQVAPPGALVWVQDYHLQLVPELLRALRPDVRIGFFLHIPFPPPELFKQLPRRAELLRGLLGADLVGFQNAGAVHNFLRLSERLLGLRVHHQEVQVGGRRVRVGAFPISIDVAQLERIARSPQVALRARQIRADLGNPDRVLLGVDRLDYTKGIEHRLKAYRELLADGRVKVPDTVLVQVAVPSRERVEHYTRLRDKVEREVGGMNGVYGRLGVPAVHYLNRSFDQEEPAGGLGLVRLVARVHVDHPAPQPRLLLAAHPPRGDRMRFPADLHRRLRVGLEVEPPAGVSRGTAVGRDDHPSVTVGLVDHRCGPRVAGPAAGGRDQQHRGAPHPTADAAAGAPVQPDHQSHEYLAHIPCLPSVLAKISSVLLRIPKGKDLNDVIRVGQVGPDQRRAGGCPMSGIRRWWGLIRGWRHSGNVGPRPRVLGCPAENSPRLRDGDTVPVEGYPTWSELIAREDRPPA